MYAAYDDLSDTIKAFLAPLSAKHESRMCMPAATARRRRTPPEAVHPVVRSHPVTGRKALYVNRAVTTRVVGLSTTQSRAMLEFLLAHQENPKYRWRFGWQPNSVPMWDNRCAQHYAIWDYFPQVCSGIRVSVIGERPT